MLSRCRTRDEPEFSIMKAKMSSLQVQNIDIRVLDCQRLWQRLDIVEYLYQTRTSEEMSLSFGASFIAVMPLTRTYTKWCTKDEIFIIKHWKDHPMENKKVVKRGKEQRSNMNNAEVWGNCKTRP